MKRSTMGMLAVAAALSAGTALAQKPDPAAGYPQRPIRVIVGFPPGGATDILARILSQHMANSRGQPVVVDNRGGATGTIGAAIVAKATRTAIP